MKQFAVHCVGAAHHNEWWVPAERLEQLNDNIVGEIELIAAYGSTPEKSPM
jgi:hypothetical protein